MTKPSPILARARLATRRPRLALGLGGLAVVLVAGLFAARAPAADTASAPSGKPGPARVENGVPESDLATVTLTPAAERRLGVTTTPLQRRPVGQTRLYSGQVMLPPTAGQMALSVLPPQTPADFARVADEQAVAEGQIARARAQLQGAREELTRAERLLREGLGTGRQVEQARTQVRVAQADVNAAQQRRGLMGADVRGMAGARTVWVRAQVYVGDLPRLNRAAPANVGGLDDQVLTPRRAARPVAAPPLADPGGATVNLFYAVDNADRAFRPGQRVGVHVPIQGGSATKLVVPWASVVHDAYGGAWVYEQLQPRRYARRRVQVETVQGAEAVLANGPAPGARIVVDGVAEIFGAEFGNGA